MTAETREETILGILEIIWGIYFLLPGEAFERISRYVSISRGFPDYIWGIIFLILGIIILPRSPLKWRKEAHAGMSICWILLIVIIFLNGFSIPTFIISTLFSVPALLHFFRYINLSQIVRI